ncbi:aldo/keto reductase [Nocardioides halotolerans]|uniref:aldo/keto reductase n=1 Tax=Nocardioides halotolerans TaxID=433660 RepID=UPI0003FF04B6|nr:aldo/keto reductase [Nocardioides halotolerans]
MPSSADAGTWRLGDRTVTRLGFGAMRLTGTRPFHAGVPRDRDTSIAVLRRAVELGVDHVDTAAFYFSRTRSANELINAALSPYPGDLTIVTKVGPVRDVHGDWAERPGPDGLRGHVEENLRQLGRDRLDVVNFRTGDDPDVAPYVAALAELVAEGLVGHVGVSAVTLDQLEAARAVTEVVCVQNRFSIDSADDLAVLRRCGELGIAFVPFFTVAGRARQGAPGEEPEAVLEVAAELDATPAQVRLAWTLALGEHVLVIPGTGSVAHLEENVAAAGLRLSAEQMARLSA